MTYRTLLAASAAILFAAADCSGGDESLPPAPPPTTSVWAARADSTRALDNPAGVDFRLYVRGAGATASASALTVGVDWTNAGPGAVDGDYELLVRLVGPVTRTVPLGTIDLGGLGEGAGRTTTQTRDLPADVVSGDYVVRLSLQRRSPPAGPVDVALRRAIFDGEGFWLVGEVTVP